MSRDVATGRDACHPVVIQTAGADSQSAGRRRRVQDAVASGRLEGEEPGPEFLADAQEYIDGGIDDAELVERGLRRWGRM